MSICLAIAFEVGAAASLASIIVLDKMNRFIIWGLFLLLTGMQMMGNIYSSYVSLHDFSSWSELFGLIEDDVIYQKRILSMVSGAVLPIVALGFIKALIDYIKPSNEQPIVSEQPDNKVVDVHKQSSPPKKYTKNIEQPQVPVEEPIDSISEENDFYEAESIGDVDTVEDIITSEEGIKSESEKKKIVS
jgi:hypothetical protein